MTEIEKIIDWMIILIACVAAVVPFVLSGLATEAKVILLAAPVAMLTSFIKNKTVRLLIAIICTPIVLFMGFRLWLG